MPPDDRNKLNRIEELKSKLFSRNYQTKIEHRDNFAHVEREEVPDSWQTQGENEAGFIRKFFMKTSIFKNFFFASIGFFILALGYASYIFFAGGNTVSNDNIDISVLGNTFTAGGDDFSLIVGITNKNSSPLDLVDLVIEYPKSISASQNPSSVGTEHLRQSLGTIPAGAVRNENIKIVLLGKQGSVIPIKISVEYRVEGSNAIFVKEKTHEVTINSTPLNLSVDAPATISPNQDITLNVKATLNATHTASNMLLRLDYPAGFQFTSSKPVPSLGNNVWVLGDLAPGAEHDILITGKMIDAFDGEEKTFHISSGSQSGTDKSLIDVVFNSISQVITIKKPFIGTQLFVNGVHQREYAVDANTKINGEIHFTNNLDTSVTDLEIRAKISGNAVNRGTISAQQGFYDSANDVIVWDKNSQSQFAEIGPGASGSVNFSMSPLALFSSLGLLPDPSINVDVSISGKQSLQGYATTDLNNSDSSVIKIISDVGFNAKALYYSGPFTNTGPIPPKVETPTSYTIVWTLSNTANNISNAIIRSILPSWVSFVGSISPKEEDLTYNASTREIVWDAGKIPKGASITGTPKSVAFQVSFTPSLSQVGTTPVIINDSTLTGHDDFANVDVRVSKTSLRTTLENDSSLPPSGGTVVQ